MMQYVLIRTSTKYRAKEKKKSDNRFYLKL